MKNKVLLVNHANSYFMGLFQIAQLFIKSRQGRPTILFSLQYPTLDADIDKAQNSGIDYLLGPAVKLGCSFEPGCTELSDAIRPKSIIDILKRSPIGPILRKIRHRLKNSTINCLRSLHKQEKYIRMILRDQQISLIILPADNRYDQAVVIKAAHREGVPVVLVPQFMAGPLEWAEYVYNQRDYCGKTNGNRLACVIFPRWLYKYKGRELIALPGSQVFARELLRIAPPLPWVLNSGFSDAMALESDAVRDYCIAEGLPASKLVVTGSVAHDSISNNLRHSVSMKQELFNKYGFSSKRRLIVSALPPDSLYMNRPDCEFGTYPKLIEFWCRSLALISHENVIICLHPSVKYDDFKYIEEWGVRISERPTFDMIPLCDIFVAAVSATIQWAIACGKPVLNYDVYRYGYYDYDCAKGVIRVNDKEEFLEKLKCLVNDSTFYDQIAACQSADSKSWGRLDGKAGNRLMKLFDELIDRRFGVQANVG